MGNPVVHFEIAGPDGPALHQFYRDLFGWKIDVQSEEMGNYGLVSANEGGIGGGVLPTTEDMPARSYVTFYVQVDDLQAALNKVASMGGNAIMPPMEIAPGMGSIALFGDPAGNTIGLYSTPPEWDGQMPPKGADRGRYGLKSGCDIAWEGAPPSGILVVRPPDAGDPRCAFPANAIRCKKRLNRIYLTSPSHN